MKAIVGSYILAVALQASLVSSHFTAFPHEHPHKNNLYYNPQAQPYAPHQYQPQPQYPAPAHPPANPHHPMKPHEPVYKAEPTPTYPHQQPYQQPYNYHQAQNYGHHQQPYDYRQPAAYQLHSDPSYQPYQPYHQPQPVYPVHPQPAHHATEPPQVKVVTTPAPPPETTTAVAKSPKYLGKFKNPTHDVEGDIFMLDQSTLYIQGFSFDGQAPDAYFWSDGVPIPYYTRSQPTPTMNLKKYQKEDVVLMLPPEKPTLEALGHFTIWCNMFNVVFGEFDMKDAHPGKK